jgi:general secretion pathway protein A
MYEHLFQFFGLRENPFHVSPDPHFYFPTRAHDTALAELQFGVDSRQGFIVLTGESGTGKTTVLNHFLNWLQDRRQSSSYIFHSLLKPSELFEYVLRDFGVPCDSRDKGEVLETLHQWLIERHGLGDSPVLIIDEAQAISVRTLDQVRLLLNLETPGSKLLQIILAGQPELEEKLRRPELRQLRQRVTFRCQLVPLSREEAGLYIKSRLAAAGATDVDVFTPASIEAAHLYSCGIPRTLNLLCEHALIAGYADRTKAIPPEIIRRVATEFDLTSQPAVERDLDPDSRFGRLVAFRPEDRTARVTAQMEYLESIDLAPNPKTKPAAQEKPKQDPLFEELMPAASAGETIGAAPSATMSEIPPLMDLPAVRSMAAAPSSSAAAAAPARIPVTPNPPKATPPAPSTLPATQPARHSAFHPKNPQSPTAHPSTGSHVMTLVAKPADSAPPPKKQKSAVALGPGLGARFVRYWKDVTNSFLYDWRQLMGAHGLARSVDTSVSSLQRNVLVPMTKWLREPAKTPQSRGKNPQAPAAGKQRGR